MVNIPLVRPVQVWMWARGRKYQSRELILCRLNPTTSCECWKNQATQPGVKKSLVMCCLQKSTKDVCSGEQVFFLNRRDQAGWEKELSNTAMKVTTTRSRKNPYRKKKIPSEVSSFSRSMTSKTFSWRPFITPGSITAFPPSCDYLNPLSCSFHLWFPFKGTQTAWVRWYRQAVLFL